MFLRFSPFLFIGLLLISAILPNGKVWAASKEKSPSNAFLEVSSLNVHADAPKAELCLSLSKEINVSDKDFLLTTLEVRQDGKKIKLAATDLSVTPQDICVQNLQHRRTYTITLRRLKSANGARLPRKYTAVATIPDRKPVLTFTGDSRRLAFPRHRQEPKGERSKQDLAKVEQAHVLRSVNVSATHLTLYKIADLALFPQAWQQFRQMNLSPSESRYFSKEKGKIVFESDLVFGDAPNQDQTLIAPLPEEKNLSPGLYYLAATPRGKEGSNPGLFAGQWFLVSDLYVTTMRIQDGLMFFASLGKNQHPAAKDEVTVAALDKDGQVLGQARTREDGSIFVPLNAQELERVAVVAGQTAAGDVDLYEVGSDRTVLTGGTLLIPHMETDKPIYRSGTKAYFIVRAENANGDVQKIGESLVQLKSPDQRLYAQQKLPAQKMGQVRVSLPLPFLGVRRTWQAQWTLPDGTLLASTPVVISPRGEEGRVSLDLSGSDVDFKASGIVTVRALDEALKPLAYKNGILTVHSARPEIKGWKSFRFGDVTATRGGEIQSFPFMTDSAGTAKVSLSFSSEQKAQSLGLDGVSLMAEMESGSRSVPLIVPVRTRSDALIGIKPLFDGYSFPENSAARFEVIAVDRTGHRRAVNGLSYLIYEEGRSFEWLPSEGHWDYTRRPNHRRIGGGNLSIPANKPASIRWPVTAGHYILDITNASGDVLARYDFDAGRRDARIVKNDLQRLHFEQDAPILEMNAPNKIKLFLSAPAIVSILVTDRKVLQTLHQPMKEGVNEITLTPSAAWGNQVQVRAEALFEQSVEPVVAQQKMTIHSPANDLSVNASIPPFFTAGQKVSVSAHIQKYQKALPVFVSVLAEMQASDGQALAPVLLDRLPVRPDGKIEIPLSLPSFEGAVSLTLTAWNDRQRGKLAVTVPVHAPLAVAGDLPVFVHQDDKIGFSVRLTNYSAPSGTYRYTITLPDGISFSTPVQGRLKLAKGQSQILSGQLSIKGQVEGPLLLELFGKSGVVLRRAWPLYAAGKGIGSRTETLTFVKPDQEALPETLSAKTGQSGVALVSPLPMKYVLQMLAQIAQSEPQTTGELAQWLLVMQTWSTVIEQAGLMNSAQRLALIDFRLRDHLHRQNEDGGFAAMRAGDPSDLTSTAIALKAIPAAQKEVADYAAAWLALRLQNTWFDEKERTPRAFAFETLASLNKADISALRYFAETSRSKVLPPDAQAALAHALLMAGDEVAAKPWIERAQDSLENDQNLRLITSWHALSFLASNDKTSFEDLYKYLPKQDAVPEAVPLKVAVERMKALYEINQRAGSWRAILNGKEEKHFGVMVLPLAAQGVPSLTNKSSRPLVITQSRVPDNSASKEKPVIDGAISTRVTTQLYDTEGRVIEKGATLKVGKIYFLLFSVSYDRIQSAPLAVHVAFPITSAYAFSAPVQGSAQAIRTLYPWTPDTLNDLTGV
ncbi:MAG: hypothetical protein AB7E52_07725, partial [Bdellovibrionales bacterium]